MKLQTVKGFRDFLPASALKRSFVLQKIAATFQKFGYDPLETPTLEYAETLKGKYGEEERLIYEFTTKGGDQVALKYDQTVPLARVIAQYPELPKPFKRYQIQSAFRGENTQKGRYREFLQADVDIIGTSNPLADAEILALATEVYKNLDLQILIKINDRALFVNIDNRYLASVDKLGKIGEQGVLKELEDKGLTAQQAEDLLNKIKSTQPSPNLNQIIKVYTEMGYTKDNLFFDPTLVRGLDYYTGMIMEVVLKDQPNFSSLMGGGRWDKMIGKFTGTDQPAVGFAIGLDRTIEAMEEKGILNITPTSAQVLVTIFSAELLNKSLEVSSLLRSNNINTEIWLNTDAKLDKQLKYADQKGIPFCLIIGPDEASKNLVTLKDLVNKTQVTAPFEEIINKLKP